MRIGMPLPEATMRSGDLVAGGSGNVAVEDGDVVGVDAQQLERGIAVSRDVCRDRFQAQAVADGFRHVGLVLDDQHTHPSMLEPPHIVGVSKTAYGLATARQLHWTRDLQGPSTSNAAPDSDSPDPRRRPPRRYRGDRRRPRLPAAGVIVLGRPRWRLPPRRSRHRSTSFAARSAASQRAPRLAWRGRRCSPRRHDGLR